MGIAEIDHVRPSADAVRIVRSVDGMHGLQEHHVEFRYPDHWFAPIPLSPFSTSIEEETISWMKALGLVNDERLLARVLAMEPRYYAGYSHSMASYDHALTYCKCITAWLLWDDEHVEVAKTFDEVENPLAALRGDQVPDRERDNPYVRAFRHIGDEYERLGASVRWRRRFADRVSEWARSAVQEEAVRRSVVDDCERSFDAALRFRTVTIGFKPTTIPLERAVGIELDDEFLSGEEYGLILEFAARICCIVNDVVGVPKDIDNDQGRSNLVLHYMKSNEISLLNSYHELLRIHDDAVADYDKLSASILKYLPPTKREKIAGFLNSLRYMSTGFGLWHRDCVRYLDGIAAQGDRVYRIGVRAESGGAPPAPGRRRSS